MDPRRKTSSLTAVDQIRRLEWHRGRLTALLRICTRVYREKDQDSLLELIAAEATRVLEAERASIFLLDREREELVSAVATGIDAGGIRFPTSSGLAGHVARTGELVNITDAYADPRFNADIDQRTGFRTRNLLAMALRGAHDEIIGVFQLLNKQEAQKFSPEDEEILTALAGQVQVAIENARLYRELEDARLRLEGENRHLKHELRSRSALDRIIGVSPGLQTIKETIAKIADSPSSVLITGESGTGKTMIAKTLHFESVRSAGPFVALNCAALPESLLESELFGIEKRVATGVDRRIGKIEAADGGTLFLDEIGDMSLVTQSKILQVIQERMIQRIGSHQSIPVDIRLIAATNKDLRAEISNGRFREDLFYRLNVVGLHMPALGERTEDIPLLVSAILARVIERVGKAVEGFDGPALDCMANYDWPGNIRELENEIERAVSLADPGQRIGIDGLSETLRRAGARRRRLGAGTLPQEIEALETELIAEALERTGGNKKAAAQALGISREGLRKKMIRLKLPR